MPDTPSSAAPAIIHLSDYRLPDYLVETVNLQFDLDETRTRVKATTVFRSNHDRTRENPPLVLYGKDLKLTSLLMNGMRLKPGRSSIEGERLTIRDVPEHIILEVETEIDPRGNTEPNLGPRHLAHQAIHGRGRGPYPRLQPRVLDRLRPV